MNHNDRHTFTFNPTTSSHWSPTITNPAITSTTSNNPENDSKRRRTQQPQSSEFPYKIPQTTQLEGTTFPAWTPRIKKPYIEHKNGNDMNLGSDGDLIMNNNTRNNRGSNFTSSSGFSDNNSVISSSTVTVPQWQPHQLNRSQSMTGLHSLATNPALTTSPAHNASRQVQSRDQSPMRSMVDLTLDEPLPSRSQQHQNQNQQTAHHLLQSQFPTSTFRRSQPTSLFSPHQHANSASVFTAPQQNRPSSPVYRSHLQQNQFSTTVFRSRQANQHSSSVFRSTHPPITRPHSTSGVHSATSASSSPSIYPNIQEPISIVTQPSAVEHLKHGHQAATLPENNNNINKESITTATNATSGNTNNVNSVEDDDDDDDDDVIIDEEMTNRNICLGMIKSDVVTKDPLLLVKDDLFEPVLMQLEGLRQNTYSFTISSKKDPKKFYGWVPFEDTSILGPIAERHLVWWDTVIPRSKANLTRTPLYIILYCRSNVYHILCRYLLHRKVELQDPPFFNPTCRYNNPKFSKKTQTPAIQLNTQPNMIYHPSLPPQSIPVIEEPGNTYSDPTKHRITQLLDSIPTSVMRRRATNTNDTDGSDIDGDCLKQYGLTMDDLHMEGLTITLLPHQVEGIRWMLDREDNEYSSGGILADDMGLGKTIQTIGLVLKTLDADRQQKTLIVAPLALIQQWASEFGTKTTKGKVKVLIHHGSDRTTDYKDFDNYDVVVTTYQIVASDLSPTERTKKRGRKRLQRQPEIQNQQLRILRPVSKDGSAQLETMDGDILGDDDMAMDNDTSAVSSRAASPDDRGQVQQEDDGLSGSTRDDGPLFQVSWHRVVLDEAQQIKNHMTRSSIACSKLVSNKRWCLTGTPIQNRVEELYSLLRFLRIPSFDDLATFKRSISAPIQMGNVELALERLKTLLLAIMLRRTKQILNTATTTTADLPQTRPISTSSSSSSSTASSQSTPTEATSSSTLFLSLPPRQKEDVVLEFTSEERALYDVLIKKSTAVVEKMVKTGKTRSYMNMLCLVLRLRQACNHPQLVLRSLNNDEDLLALTAENSSSQQQSVKRENSEATMQRVLMSQMAADLGWSGVGQVGQSVFDKTSSKHFCELCGRPVMQMDPEDTGKPQPYCSNCMDQLKRYTTMISTSASTLSSSTKINKMLDILQHTRQHHPEDKTIIFSQFTSMLDLMELPLQQLGFKYCRYDGSMPNNAREKSLQVLRSDPECRVMLISLKCGSLGLNLTAANRVILMDIWWNPAVEDQAIDRVHRIGQKLPVHVTRLLIDRTVEQKIIKLQEHKAMIANGALGDHMTSSSNLTTQELLSFFDL